MRKEKLKQGQLIGLIFLVVASGFALTYLLSTGPLLSRPRPPITPTDYLPARPGDPHYTIENVPSTRWKPSIDLFTISVPNEWKIQQFDSGAGSEIVISIEDCKNPLTLKNGISIKFGPISGTYPKESTRVSSKVGNWDAETITDENSVYILFADVYSPVKQYSIDILLENSRNQDCMVMHESIINSIIIEPSEAELNAARIIP